MKWTLADLEEDLQSVAGADWSAHHMDFLSGENAKALLVEIAELREKAAIYDDLCK